jgi:hypothetical protein
VSAHHEEAFPALLRSLEPGARVLLFALTELDYPTRILRRVAALATALDKDLHILRVLAPLREKPSHPLTQPENGDNCAERKRLALRGTAAWCARTLLSPPIGEAIQVRVGDLASEVSIHAGDLNAACVILAPSKAGWTAGISGLASSCRQPVIVATPDDEPMPTMLPLERS